jgi:hypothetical protein
MTRPWRLLTLAAGLSVTVGARFAEAQTVFVRGAPPGSALELMLGSERAATTTADAGGNGRFEVNFLASLNRNETTAHVFVDGCGSLQRVLLVESGQQPPQPEPGCNRRTVPDLFIVRRVTTLVVEVGGINLSVWIRQGPAPIEWVGQPGTAAGKRAWIPAPTGLMLSGGVDAARLSDAISVACGDAAQCAGQQTRRAFSAGATYWFTRFLAAEVTYMRPADVSAAGSDSNFRFNSLLETRIVTIAGKVGHQFGPLRLYGLAGANHTSATSTTTQTVDATATSQGGTETFPLKTSGWGWLGGAGAEGWVTPWLGVYGEGGRVALRGANVDNAEGSLDDHLTYFTIGVRLRIGR